MFTVKFHTTAVYNRKFKLLLENVLGMYKGNCSPDAGINRFYIIHLQYSCSIYINNLIKGCTINFQCNLYTAKYILFVCDK